MWVLISTDSMHSALWVSMKPMPPCRLRGCRSGAPFAAARQGSSRARSPTWSRRPGSSGTTRRAASRRPPGFWCGRCCRNAHQMAADKPPAPVTTTRSFFDMERPFTGRGIQKYFKDLPDWPQRARQAVRGAPGLGMPGCSFARPGLCRQVVWWALQADGPVGNPMAASPDLL